MKNEMPMTLEAMLNDPEKVDEFRPLVHQHMAMLTAAGVTKQKAYSLALDVLQLAYGDNLASDLKDALGVLR